MYDFTHYIYHFSNLGIMIHGFRMVYFFLAHGALGMGGWITSHRDNNPFLLPHNAWLAIETERERIINNTNGCSPAHINPCSYICLDTHE